MDFTKFVLLLDKQALFFVRSDKLSDPFEGLYPNATMTNLELNATKKLNSENVFKMVASSSQKRELEQTSKYIKKAIGLSCWHMNEYESAAMWKLYLQSTEGVSIQSNVNRFKDCFSTCITPVYIGMVQYIDYTSEDKNHMVAPDNIFRPFLHKRKSFEYENEIRALITNMLSDNIPESELLGNNGAYIPICLDILIDKIFVSPTASDWFLDLVKSISEKYGIDPKKVTRSSLADDPLY